MKFNFKKISAILAVMLTIGLMAGCTPQEPKDKDGMKEDLILNVGFLESKSVEEDQNYITIAVNGDTLKLEVKDQEKLDSLTEDEFYIFSYNKDKVLKDIQKDAYIKDVVENSMKQGTDKEDIVKEIEREDPISLDGLTLLDEYIIDFNSDGYDEAIAMYVEAESDDHGEIMWDDGQRWVLLIHGDNKDYVLYDDYVQLGSIQFNVFTADGEFNIVTKSVRTASLDISQYQYDETNDSFIQTIPYSVDGNVNMLHSSK